MNYPELDQWQARLAQQHNGILGLFIIVLIICGYMLYIRQKRYASFIRLGILITYWVSLAISGAAALMAAAGGAAYLINQWRSVLPKTKIPPIVFILILAIAVRLPGMFKSFWYDETFTAAYAAADLSDYDTLIMSDVHPPLWYLIEHVTVRLIGNSEFALRLPSLVFGVLLVWLVYKYSFIIFNWSGTANAAALLIALLPAFIHYSNEARGYMLLCCGVFIALIAARENRPFWFVAGCAVVIYTHNLGAVYIPFLLVYYFRRWGVISPINQISIVTAWFLLMIWLPFMSLQSGDIADGFWMQALHPGEIASHFFYNFFGANVPGEYVAAIAGLSMALCIFSIMKLKFRSVNVFIIGVPTVLAVASVVWHNVFLLRALLPAAALMVIGWAWVLTTGDERERRVLRWLLIPALIIGVTAQISVKRPDARSLLKAACQHYPAFATTIPAAMVAKYYYYGNVAIWYNAGDLNQELTPAARRVLFEAADIRENKGFYCFLDGYSPLNKQSEREYTKQLLTENQIVSEWFIAGNSIYTFKAYLLYIK